jgi:hypothetical protein
MPFTYVIFAPGRDAGLFAWFFLVPLAVVALLTLGSRRAATPSRPARVADHLLPAALSAPTAPQE